MPVAKKGKKDPLDDYAESLQKEINDKEKQIFSEKVIFEYNNPSNLGRMQNADGEAKVTGPCGDTMEIYFQVDMDRIIKVNFMTNGCGPTVACGSMISKLINGKKPEDVEKITPEDLITALDGLPEENEHCAKLTVDTLDEAIRKYKLNHKH